jgi:GntR family transcriptional regulator / MocR family aminotransferase
VAAGLHVTIQLPDSDDEEAIRREALERHVALETMSEYRSAGHEGPPVLLLGYAQLPAPSIRAGIKQLADAVRASRVSLDGH